MKLSILFLTITLFTFNLATPINDSDAPDSTDNSCITSEKVRHIFTDILSDQLGKVFADDFGVAYDNTIKVSSRSTTGCFAEEDLNFVCDSLYLLYETRVPESVEIISEDCKDVSDALYHRKEI